MRILDHIERVALDSPDSPFISTPGQADLSYARFLAFVKETRDCLEGLGLGGDDRVASVLTGGPENICLFFAVLDLGVFVPLNPAYSEEEFLFYLQALKVRAVVIQEGSPLWAAAEKAGIIRIELIPQSQDAAGLFKLRAVVRPIGPASSPRRSRQGDDIAILFHTSGTTSRPKIVPRTHTNLIASTEIRNRAFGLTREDCVLMMFPVFRSNMFNIALSSAFLGGGMVLAGAYEPTKFFRLLERNAPTWFVAGPAVLQSIVDTIDEHGITPKSERLRFVRSTGAPLSDSLKERLTGIFHVPVIASYGMTEVGNITSTLLGDKGVKTGSIGVSAGCEIRIVGDRGETLPPGTVGEIALRGPNVFPGYEDNPELNAAVFFDGWFRTGDMGRLDEDGYLFITGRIKELINRGGEKVYPYEVEQAILKHPAIADAAVFALRDSEREEVAAIVVVRPGLRMTLKELRRFLSGKIGHFKMPTRLFLADRIPTSQGGKVQRNSLPQYLDGLVEADRNDGDIDGRSTPPRTVTEKRLTAIWKKLLGHGPTGIDEDFFDLGGDSLSVARLYSEIERIWGCKIPLAAIYRTGTVRSLAELIEGGGRQFDCSPSLVPIRESGDKTPLFCIHAIDGEATSFRKLAEYLGEGRPVYGFRFDIRSFRPGETVTLRNMASIYIRDILSIQPTGPYFLVGHSFGGKLAYEVAQQMREMGLEVGKLILLDTISAHVRTNRKPPGYRRRRRQSMSRSEHLHYSKDKFLKEMARIGEHLQRTLFWMFPKRLRSWVGRFLPAKVVIKCISVEFKLENYPGSIIYVQPETASLSSEASVEIWASLAREFLHYRIPGEHDTIIVEPYVARLADLIDGMIEAPESRENTAGLTG